MDEQNVLLQAKDLSKVYGTVIRTKVLHELNFSISEGEFTSIIGYSGSGKSTLLNVLGALDQPTSGEIIFNGIEFGNE